MNADNMAFSGSGSGYIMGLVDAEYRPDFTKAEASEFVKKAISHAIFRDSSSGGCVRVMDICKDGCTREFVTNPNLRIQ
jgi:20S proteasome subunit beta 1